MCIRWYVVFKAYITLLTKKYLRNLLDIMHFWNLESQQHLHYVSVTDSDEEIEELPVFSFNRTRKAPTVPMMASATKLGVVKIWTSTKAEKDKKLQLATVVKEIEVRSFGGIHTNFDNVF